MVDLAEEHYIKATKADPFDADYVAALASFTAEVRKRIRDAKDLFVKACALSPRDADIVLSFAEFSVRFSRCVDK